MKPISTSLAFVFVLILLTSCAHTYQAPRIETADFLGDYSQIKEAGEDDALLSYWKKGVNWAGYKKIIVDPVIVKKPNVSELNKMPHAELFQLQEVLETRVREALRGSFRLVNKPDADTLLVRLVITEDDTLTSLLATFSSFFPSASVYSALNPLFAGDKPYAGKINIEGKVMDSSTGELLMASADARAGGNPLAGSTDELEDTARAYVFWAHHFSYRLCLRQGRSDCQRPKPS